MLRRREGDVDERTPFRPLRLSNQAHMRFLWKSISLASIAWNAGTHHVFPGGLPTTVARQHVVEIEFVPVKSVTAVLASVLVPLEDIMARKLHFLLWQAIEQQKHDHSRDPDLP